jgi:hypothetical protein
MHTRLSSLPKDHLPFPVCLGFRVWDLGFGHTHTHTHTPPMSPAASLLLRIQVLDSPLLDHLPLPYCLPNPYRVGGVRLVSQGRVCIVVADAQPPLPFQLEERSRFPTRFGAFVAALGRGNVQCKFLPHDLRVNNLGPKALSMSGLLGQLLGLPRVSARTESSRLDKLPQANGF